MLTERQFQLFMHYVNNQEDFVIANDLASLFEVSLRTIQNEIKLLRKFCKQYTSFKFSTRSNKGAKLEILDKQQFNYDLDSIKKEALTSYPTDNRLNSLLLFLLDRSTPVTKFELMDHFFISETTLYHSINKVKKELKNYDLSLEYKTNIGYLVVGTELDKRKCIKKIDFNGTQSKYLYTTESTARIYTVVTDTFIKYRYHLNEQTLQNITTHIARSLRRIEKFQYITTDLENNLESTTEFNIAKDILSCLISPSEQKKPHFLNETVLLTQIILGKLEYTEDSVLQKEINEFINHAFESIHKQFFINLDSLDDFKLLLALHLTPLFFRIKSGTQFVNWMSVEIRQSFPQAFDIAIYFSMLIEERFNLIVSQDEVSYLALYFNYALENFPSSTQGKKILIISPLRKSETILLRHKILSWFPKQIESITFVFPDQIDVDLDNYDAIFSTEEELDKYHGSVSSVSLFPTEKDFKKINLAINGYTDMQTILDKFTPSCFYTGNASTKEEVLNIISANSIRQYKLDDNFLEIIKDRENITSSYFGNGVAIPHPLTPVTDETFVSIAILDEAIPWDNNHKVRFVMLVSIAKNNPKEFQFWYYLSSFIRNEEMLKKILAKPSFDFFLESMSTTLEKEFR